MKAYEGFIKAINEGLDKLVAEKGFSYKEEEVPFTLNQSMAYSLLAGGKRIRPTMLLGAYHMLKEDWGKALPYALALEMIHTYSLIHDDLPSMDNDDLRRGKATNHIVFGEANALLAGDGLLNLAYEILFNEAGRLNTPEGIEGGRIIAHYAGRQGMIGGQVVDLEQEKKEGNEEILFYIQRHKTAALFMAAMECGVCLGGGNKQEKEAAKNFGYHYGIAFQMIDDLLDVRGDSLLVGKTLGKDETQKKLTWPRLIGIEKTEKRALEHTNKAITNLEKFGKEKEFLITLAQSGLKRLQ